MPLNHAGRILITARSSIPLRHPLAENWFYIRTDGFGLSVSQLGRFTVARHIRKLLPPIAIALSVSFASAFCTTSSSANNRRQNSSIDGARFLGRCNHRRRIGNAKQTPPRNQFPPRFRHRKNIRSPIRAWPIALPA